MSINVYLKGDEVQKIAGFTAKSRRTQDNEWTEYRIPGVKLYHGRGRWYTTLYEPTEPIPAAVADIVDEITFQGWIQFHTSRESGIYSHESAEAEVDLNKTAENNLAKVQIRAKKIVDLLELYHKIRAGSIRPEQSYEVQQSGMSRAELEKELDHANRDLEILKTELEQMKRDTNGDLGSLKADLRALCRELERGWPIRVAATIMDKIYMTLNNYRI